MVLMVCNVFQDVTIDLLVESVERHKDAAGIIIEGYPRTVKQRQEFDTRVSSPDFRG